MAQLPILDLASVSDGSNNFADLSKTALELHEALSETGFLMLTNHGIPKEKIDALYNSATAFFQAPAGTKDKFLKPNDRVAYHGYSFAADPEAHKYREYFHWWPNNPECNLDPEKCLSDDTAMPLLKSYIAASRDIVSYSATLCHLIFDLLTQALSLEDRNFFADKHVGLGDIQIPNHTYLASIYYPPLGDEFVMPLNKPRMGAHTDWDTFTLLFLDPVGGLEAKSATGDWIPTDPIPDANGNLSILLIVGDFLEKWSGGIYKATEHRVLVPTGANRLKSRLSLPYFVLPDNSVNVEKFTKHDTDSKCECDNKNPPEKINVGEYFRGNAQRTFNKTHGITD